MSRSSTTERRAKILTVYMRSSSYGGYSLCPHKNFLSYTLGIPEDPGKAATMGNVYHKVMECLALGKLQHQEGKSSIILGDEYIGAFEVDDLFNNEKVISPLCKLSLDYHHDTYPSLKWVKGDLATVTEWVNRSITESETQNDPRNKDVAFVEKYFDFEIDEPWAEYNYKIGDREIKGKLALKGTMDLITRIDDESYEVLDYKSGQHRSDFATGEEKTHKKLQTDPQLLIYYYACRKLFPKIVHFDFSIYFLNAGGMYTLCFDDESLVLAENLIRERFELMRDDMSPRLMEPTRKGREKGNYKCYNCCTYQKKNQPGTDLSICEFFKNEIEEKGIDVVTNIYCNWDAFGVYGDGGGRKKEE